MASVNEELNFKLYLISIHSNVNSHVWIMPTILGSTTIKWEQGSLPCFPSMTNKDGEGRILPV